MTNTLNFAINPVGSISKKFLAINRHTFGEAASFVRQLVYARNSNKADLLSVFADNCGTCSTKHALLKLLCEEHNFMGIKLILGLFRMNVSNTPKITKTLKASGLDYIPEAHNYLRFENQILDYTTNTSTAADFENELMEEIEILPYQITDFKVDYHKQFLANWLKKNSNINLTLDELWYIREQCIQDLSTVI